MAFDSRNTVVILSSAEHVYTTLSSEENFARVMHLSPTCHSVKVVSTDQVSVHLPSVLSDGSLDDIAANRPLYHTVPNDHSSDASATCTRVCFEMVERVPVLFGMIKNNVTIRGTQIMSSSQKFHIYESDANKGLVKIYKLRRFVAKEQQKTLVEELICGTTYKILRRYTQTACRAAHQAQMQLYQSLMQ